MAVIGGEYKAIPEFHKNHPIWTSLQIGLLDA
jgi:hypothetical protein